MRRIKSKTVIIDIQSIYNNDKLITLIPRLMMACNDLALSNTCLNHYKGKSNKKDEYNFFACRYFIRLQIGHVEEGLKVIKIIKEDSYYKRILNKLPPDAKESFDKLCSCIDDSNSKWKKYFKLIRSNLSFHYNDSNDSKYIREALKDRVSIKGQKTSKITIGIGNVEETFFELGDEIIDSIVCRKIFKIPYSVKFEKDRTDLDNILESGSDICKAFVIFGTYFIYNSVNLL